MASTRSRTWLSSFLPKLWRWTRRFAFAAFLVGLTGGIALWVTVRKLEAELPSLTDLKGNYNPPQTTRVLARDGSLLAEIFTERRTLVHIADLPHHVKLAILAAEDAGFYEHEGLDYWGIVRAFVRNARSLRIRGGGSTITQQVIKNILLTPEQTYERKLKEAILARRLEQNLSKDEILEIYVNHVNFGQGRYGIEEAARGTFGKPAKELSIAQAAILAGSLKGPRIYSPHADFAKAQERKLYVLHQLQDKKLIDDAAFEAAKNEPIVLVPEDKSASAGGTLAPEVLEIVKRELHEKTKDRPALGGYTVYTTIDRALQEAARKSIRDAVSTYDKRHLLQGPLKPPALPKLDKKGKPIPVVVPKGAELFEGFPRYELHRVFMGEVVKADDEKSTLEVRVGTVHGKLRMADVERYNPKHLKASEFAPERVRLRVSLLAPAVDPQAKEAPSKDPAPKEAAGQKPRDVLVPLRLESGPESALVSIDVHTREILALVGNIEGIPGGLDRSTQSHRQPGSTFKPIVYSYALKSRRFTAASTFDPTPEVFEGNYKPTNFEGWKGLEHLRLREALAQSVNIVAVRVLKEVGPASVVDYARSLGIRSKMEPNLSLALGSYEVTPLELAGVYATFAAGGMYAEPKLIRKIEGANGFSMEFTPNIPEHRVLEENEAYLMTDMLTTVVQRGTAVRARELGRPIAGKTGTSNAAKDTWFAGYSPEIATVMWVGFDDAKPLGPQESGAQTVLPGWIQYMKVALKQRAPVDFPRPQGFITQSISKLDGLLAREDDPDPMEEIFLPDTEPKERSTAYPDGGAPDAMLAPSTPNTPTPTALEPTTNPGTAGFDASEGTP